MKNNCGKNSMASGRRAFGINFSPQTSKYLPQGGSDMTAKRLYIKTFGCQMNIHDSERVKDLLLAQGYSLSRVPEESDIVLFNTCSVRRHAEDRVFGEIGRLRELKIKNEDLKIGILGCMAEAQGEKIFRRFPYVDFLCGPADLDSIPWIIDRIIYGAGHIICIGGHRWKKIPEFLAKRQHFGHMFVKIMEGCSNFCSYCVVPYVRGPERSRSSKEILHEVRQLVNKGVDRITLLGQNVNSYGRGLREKITFPELLRKIDKMVEGDCFGTSCLAMTPGEGRLIRGKMENMEIDFVTSHPKDASIEMFEVMAASRYISKKLHLPLQSGSNKILKMMNRNYTVEKYKSLVKEFRRMVKGASVSTDIIVGFPRETKKDFQDTLKAVKEIEFDAAYIFKYSPRPRTKANEFNDDVPEYEKKRRHALLLKEQKEISITKKLYTLNYKS